MPAPIPSDTNIEVLNKTLEIAVWFLGFLVAAIAGFIGFLFKRWKNKLKDKDKQIKERDEKIQKYIEWKEKISELFNWAKTINELEVRGIIKTEPNMKEWLQWWCSCANALNLNNNSKTQEIIERFIHGKEV